MFWAKKEMYTNLLAIENNILNIKMNMFYFKNTKNCKKLKLNLNPNLKVNQKNK